MKVFPRFDNDWYEDRIDAEVSRLPPEMRPAARIQLVAAAMHAMSRANVAAAIRQLGNGDAETSKGAIECLGDALLLAAERIADSGNEVANALLNVDVDDEDAE
jgi:histone H3/H4